MPFAVNGWYDTCCVPITGGVVVARGAVVGTVFATGVVVTRGGGVEAGPIRGTELTVLTFTSWFERLEAIAKPATATTHATTPAAMSRRPRPPGRAGPDSRLGSGRVAPAEY